MELTEIKSEVSAACAALLDAAKLSAGEILVVGCSSSEILGGRIGTYSSPEVGKAVFDGLMEVLSPRGIYLAAQCCEHLNRSLILERDALPGVRGVNVIPQPKAGGSFATAAYHGFAHPMAIEGEGGIADAGMDIGGTLIGMHLRRVAVPVRLSLNKIGQANILCARTRPKYIGGQRAVYQEM